MGDYVARMIARMTAMQREWLSSSSSFRRCLQLLEILEISWNFIDSPGKFL